MMRAPGSLAIVCRRRNGSLVIRERSVPVIASGPKTWPFLRGMLTLFSSLRLGSQSLKWSAQVMEQDYAEEEQREAIAKGEGKSKAKSPAVPPSIFTLVSLAIARVATLTGEETPTDDGDDDVLPAAKKKASWPPKPDETVNGTFQVTPKAEGSKIAAIIPVAFAVFLFIALPQATAEAANSLFKLKLEVTSPGYQVITGAAKLCIIIGYLSLIRLMPDVKRVFQYHGAEHKAISTYEAKRELVVSEARAMTALHARCGTTFIIMVAFVSVVCFSVVGAFLPPIPGGRAVQSVGFFLMKLPLFPVIAGITFELQRFFARYCSTGPLRALLWPGFLVQKITTAPPDDDQLEIALASLRASLAHAKIALPEDHPDRSFASYGTLLGDPSFRMPVEVG